MDADQAPCGNALMGGSATRVVGAGQAADHARAVSQGLAPILRSARRTVTVDLTDAPDVLVEWARSGAMALTGAADGPPLASRGRPASAIRAALALFAALSPSARDLPGPELLGERAAIAGLSRNGPLSCGGATRLVPCADGDVALSLAREDDLMLVAALVEAEVVGDPWSAVAAWCRSTPAEAAAERAQLLGLPAAVVGAGTTPSVQDEHRRALTGDAGIPWLAATPGGMRRPADSPLVVDLSSLWAGPLCAHLLGLSGARVVKVESTTRPDGARRGPAEFYDLLHAGHDAVALDLAGDAGRARLRALLRRADVVIEASRPRALAGMGIDAQELVASGTTWVSITAQGRSGPWSNRVGFGDDVAAGAGLLATGATLMPAGDAIADPLAGVHAAVAVAAALTAPQAWLLDVSMHHVAALAAQGGPAAHRVRRDGDHGGHVGSGWVVEVDGATEPVARPRSRTVVGHAAPMGRDTARHLSPADPS